MFDDLEIQFYGTGKIGEKGQIVIPAKAREKLAINPEDEFIFFGHGPMIHLVKANELNEILDTMTRKIMKKISGIVEIKKKVATNQSSK